MNFTSLLSAFKVQPELNKQLWNNNMLNPNVRLGLLKVAEYFYNSIKLDKKPVVHDVVFTGSLANYNYSEYSDIDVHILFNFDEMEGETELIEQFFILAKASWNDQHDITIKGYPVEIYAEDYRSPHVSTGLYSVMQNIWIKHPEKITPVFDNLDVNTKVKYISGLYKHFEMLYTHNKLDNLDEKIHKLREKIGQYRQAGLDVGGELSTENVTFKVMRRIGLLDKLKELQDLVVNKKLTIKEII